MRDYAQISPRFWVGKTGREIREAGRDAQLLASYLMTSPSSNMIGLYYLPVPTVLHELAFSAAEFQAAMEVLSRVNFAFYDREVEMVFVPEMGRYQVGATLNANDKRRPRILKALEACRGCQYYALFWAKYSVAWLLPADLKPTQDAPSVIETQPVMPLAARGMQQEKEKEKEKEQENENEKRVREKSRDDQDWEGQLFDRLFQAHPSKLYEQEAQRALFDETRTCRIRPDRAAAPFERSRTVSEVLACHAAWCASERWKEGNGKYAPALGKWLKNGGYLNPPPTPVPEKVPIGLDSARLGQLDRLKEARNQ